MNSVWVEWSTWYCYECHDTWISQPAEIGGMCCGQDALPVEVTAEATISHYDVDWGKLEVRVFKKMLRDDTHPYYKPSLFINWDS